MKKLALSLAVLFSVAMVSCGGNKEDKACDSTCDTTVEMTEEAVVVDSPVADSVDAAKEETKADVAKEEVKAEDSAKAEQK